MKKVKKMNDKELRIYLGSGITGDEYKKAMDEYLSRMSSE